jgi:uncharacterized membrane protein YkoI
MNMMKRVLPYTLTALTLGYAGVSLAAIDKDQAIAMAQQESPGELIKAYQETKKGQEVWEVQIAGEDGKKYEYYYAVENGELVKKEVEDHD